ncbi:MAG: hypothetical protein GY847_19000, partial [Proteobacteria bacterium]|nr:hypothetical protein [Pseudomonadota bacterium]
IVGGKTQAIYLSNCSGDIVTLKYLDLETKKSYSITDNSEGNPSGYAFDGERWVVWIFDDKAYKFDISNPGDPVLLAPDMRADTWPVIHDGKVYTGTWRPPPWSDDKLCDVHIHDLTTGENSFALSQDWDQIQISVSGNIAAYLDTETLGTKWFGDNISQIEIGDLETGVTRQITELPSVYWGTAIEGKYL